MTRSVLFFVFPKFQILDLAGPLGAFEIADRLAPGSYALRVVALDAGAVTSSSGLDILAQDLASVFAEGPTDTLVVAGGSGAEAAADVPGAAAALARVSAQARRTASVCTGAFLLAAAGVLDGRQATTHWRRAAELARRFPRVQVHADRIWVRDEEVWTSAGITAGVDLALALIGADLGEAVAARTAKELVVQHRRSGGQSQFSALSELPIRSDRIGAALRFARERLDEALPVERLSQAANLSPRQFARLFRAETGITPAKAVERLRLEAAQAALESGPARLEAVALAAGFGDPERMRRAFVRTLGRPPQALRRDRRARGS